VCAAGCKDSQVFKDLKEQITDLLVRKVHQVRQEDHQDRKVPLDLQVLKVAQARQVQQDQADLVDPMVQQDQVDHQDQQDQQDHLDLLFKV
jgi:hypothetical protein